MCLVGLCRLCSMDVKTEPDSNDINEYSHDDQLNVGMFKSFCFQFISFFIISDER